MTGEQQDGAKMINKYFILKDFIGYPIGIVKGTYSHGILVSGDFRCPRKLNNKFPGFDSLDDVLSYKICNCGKSSCKYNKELIRIASKLLIKEDA